MDRIAELEAQVETLQRKNESLEIEAAQAKRSAERATIESKIRAAAVMSGRVRDEASVEDVVHRALTSGQWKLDSTGKLIRQRDGADDRHTNGDPVTPSTWIRSLQKEAPLLFKDAQDQEAQSAGQNPWTKEHWSLTEQGKIARDPNDGLARAEQMAKAAGSRLGATRPPA